MTEPLTPDQVTDLLSCNVSSLSDRELAAAERFDIVVAEAIGAIARNAAAAVRARIAMGEFGAAYSRIARPPE
jgi:hypothetical protein